ncbi:DNA cytosine methyltransferase [Clostridium perfringens]|uniref:DNA cytosine methyltransferase n=1 Tax=Clostridium perfringens TaxID=1502 RepID=UPI00111E199E|nr:DNA cytosine methyltransferase [Clostridium perfringens]MDM0947586.1 DNA cytosine methyltransferase [Clostridium perfringens]TPE14358.1 DNA cytosine methyltransferase [Clostridium perfringens]TPE14361.1 DNA cytosine methyltransferase [Clostridium perfringens]
MSIISLFAGAGGLDLGFENAGWNIDWACEYDKTIWDTYRLNHPNTYLETKSITDVNFEDLPEVVTGIIGGPPCQSWSLAGSMRGIDDPRGQLFNDYLRLLREKQPMFFLVENVPGMLSKKHIGEFEKFIERFKECGYRVTYRTLNAMNFGVAQNRKRVIIIGYRNDLNLEFNFDELTMTEHIKTIEECIGDLPNPLPALEKNYANPDTGEIFNNEYYVGSFSSIYMSRNRRKEWNEPSFTIQASGRQAPIYPGSDPMEKVGTDKWRFTGENYRRLSVRECARIQGFPDDFRFIYNKVEVGYKMIGNAVPVELARVIAEKIRNDLAAFID